MAARNMITSSGATGIDGDDAPPSALRTKYPMNAPNM